MIRAENVVTLPKTDLELLVEEWLTDLRVAKRTPKTRDGYMKNLRLFMRRTGIKMLDALTDKVIKAYLIEIEEGNYEGMRKGSSASTQHSAWRSLRAFIGWGLKQEYPPAFHSSLVDQRPGVRQWFRVPEPRVDEEEIETFSAGELAKIDQAGKRYVDTEFTSKLAVDRRYTLLMHALLGTGLRIEELIQLTVDDIINPDEGDAGDEDAHAFFRVHADKATGRTVKSHKPRFAPVSARLYRELLAYQSRERPKTSSNVLFVDEDGHPLNQHGPQQFFQRLSKRTGIHVHAHKFRHTFATNYLTKHPGDIERLRRILGHRDYTMVMRYVHFSLQTLGAGWENASPY